MRRARRHDHGRLAGERVVEVDRPDASTRRLTARRAVVVATGSWAAIPPIEGLREIRTWDSRDVTSAKDVPRRLLVLGGGVVGVEMAQAWRRLGTEEVTVVEALERLVPNEEPFVGDELRRAFEAEGITVVTGTKVVGAAPDADDAPVAVTLEDGLTLTGDELLVAVGRRPRTTVSYPLGNVAAASVSGEGIAGTAHLVIDQRRRVIVGATFTGPDIAELLHSATIAVVGAVPLDVLWHAVPSFPTYSEAWLRLLETDGL